MLGKSVRLGTREATIVGVLQPSVSSPAETEIIANIATSPHHMSAAMTSDREHRMTELFGRLAPGADLETREGGARGGAWRDQGHHAEAYDSRADFRIDPVPLRDQVTRGAKTMLLILMAAAALVFVVACANAANLVLARTLSRQPEMAVRAALGASRGNLRGAPAGGVPAAVGWRRARGSAYRRRRPSPCSPESRRGSPSAPRTSRSIPDAAVGRRGAVDGGGRGLRLHPSSAFGRFHRAAAAAGHLRRQDDPRGPRTTARLCRGADCRLVRPARRRRPADADPARAPCHRAGLRNGKRARDQRAGHHLRPLLDQVRLFYDDIRQRVSVLPGVTGVAVGSSVPWRDVDG